MLADEVQGSVAVCVTPQPSLRSVVARAIFIASGQVPERNRHFLPSQPLPRVPVLSIPHRAHPVLRVGIATMTPPQLPANESLQGRVALVDQSTAARSAEGQGVTEVQRLAVVENVALSIVAGGGTWWLVAEHGASLNRQCLISVHEGFADRQLAGSRTF